MKFRFEGLDEIIEIDFNFLKYSEFIQAMEPDRESEIYISELFSKLQIGLLKEVLEKGKGKRFTKEEMYLIKSESLKPLFDFFKFNEDFRKDFYEVELKIESPHHRLRSPYDFIPDRYSDYIVGERFIGGGRILFKSYDEARRDLERTRYTGGPGMIPRMPGIPGMPGIPEGDPSLFYLGIPGLGRPDDTTNYSEEHRTFDPRRIDFMKKYGR